MRQRLFLSLSFFNSAEAWSFAVENAVFSERDHFLAGWALIDL